MLNGSGRSGLSTTHGRSPGLRRPRRLGAEPARPTQPATTKIVVYNGAEAELPETIKYLENLFNVKVTTATDPR